MLTSRRAFLFGMLALLPAAAWRGSAAQGRGSLRFARGALAIRTAKATHRFEIEIAKTSRQHSQGLMFRRRLAPDAGMLFLYGRPHEILMWMKNTFIPLDMVFIAADGKIVSIAERTVPKSLETISSGVPATAVLEVNAGTVRRLGIRVGDRILHPAFGSGS